MSSNEHTKSESDLLARYARNTRGMDFPVPRRSEEHTQAQQEERLRGGDAARSPPVPKSGCQPSKGFSNCVSGFEQVQLSKARLGFQVKFSETSVSKSESVGFCRVAGLRFLTRVGGVTRSGLKTSEMERDESAASCRRSSRRQKPAALAKET